MKDSSGSGKSILTKAVLFFGLTAFILIGTAVFKEYSRKKQIQNHIKELQIEAERISRKNALMKEKIAYLESQDFKEREAKDKLNLQSPDENVVIVEPGVIKKEEDFIQANPAVDIPSVQRIANPAKWWNYFFQY